MDKLILTPIEPSILIDRIAAEVVGVLEERGSIKISPSEKVADDPLDDFIPKHEVRGKLASSATLWKWEKAGKIKSYGIGGKRFYKRSELAEAITEMK